MRSLFIPIVVFSMASGLAVAQSNPWQVPARGPGLSPADVQHLAGKTCWGWFDRGNNAENARGAVFITFGANATTGELWRKWGKDAQLAPRRSDPQGYDDMGKLGPIRLSDTGTEITFKADNWFFDWFIRPSGDATFALRAAGTTDRNRGATGVLSCP